MASAYQTVANLGTRVEPTFILKVIGPDGKVVKDFSKPEGRNVLDPRVRSDGKRVPDGREPRHARRADLHPESDRPGRKGREGLLEARRPERPRSTSQIGWQARTRRSRTSARASSRPSS